MTKIQGPISNTPTFVAGSGESQKIFNIFNKTVVIDETTTKFTGTSFEAISKDDIVEISGFDTTATDINATFVKRVPGSEVELKGHIGNLSLTSQSFLLSGVTINFTNSTSIDVTGGTLRDGLFVEVEGILQSPTSILADEIEEEDEDFEDGTEINLQGVVADFVDVSDFTVGSLPVDASGASFSPLNAVLENGINIEVEGSIVDGVLIADEVELREGSVKVKGIVSNVLPASNQFDFTFVQGGSITIHTDTQTSFEDELVPPVPNFSLVNILNGEFIKIEGFDNNGQITATKVERKIADDTEVQGSVESIPTPLNITIHGISFTIDGSTTLPLGFFGLVKLGDIVKVEDNLPADGIADEIEFGD